MHVLRLKLKTSEYQEHELEKRFRCIWHIHNVAVKYAQKQLNKMRNDMGYIAVIREYIQCKNVLKKAKNKSEKKELDTKIKSLLAERQRYILGYGLTKTEIEKFCKVQAFRFAHLVSSQQVQKEVARVIDGVDDVLYGSGKELHFKKLSQTDTICGKSPTNGIRYFDNSHTSYYPKRIIPKFYAEIEYLGLQIEVTADFSDPYISQSLQGDISYCEIKRIMFENGWHYYVNLYIKSPAPKKNILVPVAEQGMDLGVSTVATVSDNNAILEELAPKSSAYEAKIKKLQKKIDVSKRVSNPGNFNNDGTCKSGHLGWNYSKNCLRKMKKVSLLYRKKASYVEHSHYILANKVLKNGNIIYTEEMNFRLLQKRSKKTERRDTTTTVAAKSGKVIQIKRYKRKKRFGHSLANRAPSSFLTILSMKIQLYGGVLIEVDTKSFKASQYRHDTDQFEKISLSQRTKCISGYEVQRDLYSAFLLLNTNDNHNAPDRAKCTKNFPKFIHTTNNLIALMKSNGISMKQCFGF